MKLLEVLFIATGFGIFEATDMTLLQTFMEKNLSPRPPARLLAQNPGSPHSPPSPICPKEIKVSWQLRPPYTLEDKNSTDDQPTINGIFHHALEFALEKCCLFYRGNKSIMRYLAMSDNSTALKHTTFAEDSIIAFPIQRDWYIGSRRRYINILDSPGVVIIQRGPSHTTAERRAQLFKAILETWPVVVLSLLLSSLAGIVIWMLETGKNAEEFDCPFYRGAFDGFWWAFVSMSTVGYGDKTPKSVGGRLFSVLWIMTGITVCSILTATLSSALTNVAVSAVRYDVTTRKTIGVQRETFAFKRAVNLGINITDFQNLHEAFHSLENGKVQGIMEELFTGIEFIKNRSNLGLSIAEVFEDKHGYGVAIREDGFSSNVLDCLSKVTEFVSDEIYSNISEYVRAIRNVAKKPSRKNLAPGDTPKSGAASIFDKDSYSFKATVIGISVALLFFITSSVGFVGYRYLRRKRLRKEDLEAGEK